MVDRVSRKPSKKELEQRALESQMALPGFRKVGRGEQMRWGGSNTDETLAVTSGGKWRDSGVALRKAKVKVLPEQ